MTAGYSDTPLVRKLGGKENQRVGVLGDPGHFYSRSLSRPERSWDPTRASPARC